MCVMNDATNMFIIKQIINFFFLEFFNREKIFREVLWNTEKRFQKFQRRQRGLLAIFLSKISSASLFPEKKKQEN